MAFLAFLAQSVNTATLTAMMLISFAAKKMRKKKIVFSSSGGTPAMQLLMHLVDNFGKYDIERIAAEIAAMCRGTRIIVTASCTENVLVLNGNTAMCLRLLGDTVAFDADNVTREENVLVIS